MTPEQQRLTRDQWRVLEIREECAREFHQPSRHVNTWTDPMGTWACDCAAVKWTPTTREATND